MAVASFAVIPWLVAEDSSLVDDRIDPFIQRNSHASSKPCGRSRSHYPVSRTIGPGSKVGVARQVQQVSAEMRGQLIASAYSKDRIAFTLTAILPPREGQAERKRGMP
jgi:hypothetical protein